jgi:hypothetical protein
MALQVQLWRIENDKVKPLSPSVLENETRLENWIEQDPSLLGEDLLIIGRQVRTDFGGYIDLLAISSSGEIVILELKRDMTPRDVVAQGLDYASWIETLDYNRLDQICKEKRGKSLGELFQEHFEEPIGEVNETHRIVLVAAQLDDASERIVRYLANNFGLNINAIYFHFLKDGDREYLARAWLIDPEIVEEKSASKKQPAWSGFYFVNVGESEHRNWEDNVKYGFVGAGQGPKYSQPLKKLKPGDAVFGYMKGLGYVGFGEVTGESRMIRDFRIGDKQQPILSLPLKALKPGDHKDDPEYSEWIAPIKWHKTFPREQAKTFKGAFANQNIVCKLRDPATVEFLKKEFGIEQTK